MIEEIILNKSDKPVYRSKKMIVDSEEELHDSFTKDLLSFGDDHDVSLKSIRAKDIYFFEY